MAERIYFANDKITSENLEAFKEFVLQNSRKNKEFPEQKTSISPSFIISEDINLKDFFPQTMSEEYKREMYDVLSRNISENCTPKQRDELLAMMDTRPDFVAKVINYAGNKTHSQYDLLIQGLKERPIVENLKLYDSMLKSGYTDFWHFTGQPEPVKHLTQGQKKIIADWEFMKEESQDRRSMAATYINDLLETGILLNCDNLSPGLRKQVNKHALSANWQKYSWPNLESRFMDKEFLTELFQKTDVEIPRDITSPNAKTQKEKNAEILPKHYTNVRDALLREAENAPKYDNYGKRLNLNKRFLSLIGDIKGQSYDIEKNKASVLFYVYRDTAQKDITAGRAEELDAKALNVVLVADKDNYYIRKIPAEVIEREKIELNSQQREILGVSKLNDKKDYEAIYFAEHAATSKTLNREEKDKVANDLDKMIADQTSKLQSEKQQLEEKRRDEQKLRELSQEYTKAFAAKKTIQNLQQLYGNILSGLKNGKPNDQEKEVIDKKQIEKVISDVLEGKSVQVAFPEQKSLPLLFGRAEEKQRRNDLDRSIGSFNQFLQNVKANREELKQYSGSLLNEETLEKALQKEKEAKQTSEQTAQQTNLKWQGLDIDDRHVKQSEDRLKKMQGAKDKILQRKQQIKDLAKENMSVESKETLEDVSRLSGEQKHHARAENKTKGKDKLAEKVSISQTGKDALYTTRAQKLREITKQR